VADEIFFVSGSGEIFKFDLSQFPSKYLARHPTQPGAIIDHVIADDFPNRFKVIGQPFVYQLQVWRREPGYVFIDEDTAG